MLQAAREKNLNVRTDHRAPPTGFPFKVVEIEGTVGMKDTYQARPRLCDLGYLRTHTITPEGKTISKCAAEPDAPYLKKGGKEEDLDKRICLGNGLMASIGLGQERPDGYKEAPLLTLGVGIIPYYLRNTDRHFALEKFLCPNPERAHRSSPCGWCQYFHHLRPNYSSTIMTCLDRGSYPVTHLSLERLLLRSLLNLGHRIKETHQSQLLHQVFQCLLLHHGKSPSVPAERLYITIY